MLLFNIPLEFFIFGLTLMGIAIFHRQTFKIAFGGLVCLLFYKIYFLHFPVYQLLFNEKEGGEWEILVNLFGLLTGFAILSAHFEESRIPRYLPALLPDDWKGGFVLLIIIAVLSAFLDNIAAALIGVSIAHVVFEGKLHTGYLAAIVAASNAGGAGSVLGDTTTTMMWIAGIPASKVFHAYIASWTAILFFGIIASKQQHRFNPILKDEKKGEKINWPKFILILLILCGAILSNLLIGFPSIGVWSVIIVGSFFISTPWHEFLPAAKGSLFLLCLVLSASLMPVKLLPPATLTSTFCLGIVSAFFDNIPLTKLALDQGGYDWGILAYAVGFGGSMLWFGSSAGVAVAGKYEQAKSVTAWIKNGWHVAVAYVLGFLALALTLGWNPS